MTKLSDQITTALSATESGIYSWQIATNRVYADATVARFFQLAPDEAERGLPLERYLERIHAEDQPRTAKAIYDAVISGGSYQEDYRIRHDDGSIIHILAIGKCFRNEHGAPSGYAGVLYNMTADESVLAVNAIADLCLAAYGIAKVGHDDVVIDLLHSLLTHMRMPTEIARKDVRYRH